MAKAGVSVGAALFGPFLASKQDTLFASSKQGTLFYLQTRHFAANKDTHMKHKLRIWNERVLRRVVVEIDAFKKYPEDGAIAEFHIVAGIQSRAEAMKHALELVRILSPESCQNLRVISTVKEREELSKIQQGTLVEQSFDRAAAKLGWKKV